MAKAEGRRAGVEIGPVVVRQGDGDGDVLGAVVIRVADERRLPVGVEPGVGHGDAGDAVGEVKETIVANENKDAGQQRAERISRKKSQTNKSLSWSLSLERSTWSTHT